MPIPTTPEAPPVSYQEQSQQMVQTGQGIDPWQADDQQRLFNFDRSKPNLKILVDQWGPEVYNTEANRSLRKLDIDPNVLQSQGKIDSDETVIPVRAIDTNIKRELPTYIGYTQQSRRIVTFTDRSDPSLDCQMLEEEFSRLMTYNGWMSAHNKLVDGTLTHGWDFNEVVFDETKPGHCAIEHVGHSKMIFPYDAIDIQACETIIRVYTVTQTQLKTFVRKFGFDVNQVKLMIDSKGDSRKNESLTIYKQFFKYGGVVFVAWFELTFTNGWLKAPTKLFLGRQSQQMVPQQMPMMSPMTNQPVVDPTTGMPMMETQLVPQWQDVDETEYPVFLYQYEDIEDDRLVMNKGRVFMDKPSQEAQTALWSACVNGYTRASQVYGSPETGAGGRPKAIEDARLIPGRMYSEKINFWHTDPPDEGIVRAAQALAVQNSSEAGQINYAASNRVDSRKTAEEVKQGSLDQNLLKSVQVTNYSSYLRSIYSFCWKIVQSQALQGKVTIAVDPSYLMRDYDIRAAGDIDVIQRAEKINRMKQDWPVISQTPLAIPFLMDLIKISYPEDYSRYQAIMQQGDPKKAAIQQLLVLLKGSLTEEEVKALPPEGQQQATAIVENATKQLQMP